MTDFQPTTPPRTVLDEAKRLKIVTLLSNGHSRRTAARYVGCAPSTITRTAARDPEFAARIAVAEQAAEIDALRSLRAAARKDRYWRAAAWLLERRNPTDFALRPQAAFSYDDLANLIGCLADVVREEVSEEACESIIARLDAILAAYPETNPHADLPPPKLPLPKLPGPAGCEALCILPVPLLQHPADELGEVVAISAAATDGRTTPCSLQR